VTAISAQVNTNGLGNELRRMVEESLELGQQFARSLEAVEQYMPISLDDSPEGEDPPDDLAAREGTVVLDPETLAALRSRSPLIDTLHRSGLNLLRLHNFTEAERRLAASIGSHFNEFMDLLQAFRRIEPSRDEGEHTFVVRANANLGKFIATLEKEGVFKFKIALFRSDKGTQPVSRKWLGSRKEGDSLRLIVTDLDPRKRQFLTGDWLTCFVLTVIEDHLNRNNVAHEIYAKVAYKAPPDIVSVSSDFDVLVWVGNRVLCFECKSGRVDAGRGNLNAVIDHANDLTNFFDRFMPKSPPPYFFFVYDPTTNDPAWIQQALASTPIMPHGPSEIREVIVNFLPRA
jgi:hypothetical protein